MEVVYYFDDDLNVCPVKKYFEEVKSDNTLDEERKKQILHLIMQKIQFVKENPGGQAKFLSTLHGHNFIEIKTGKDRNTVIRVLYFMYEEKIVLLSAFEKPSKYDTHRIKKEVEKEYKITDVYVKKFKDNSANYEIYE